MSRSIVVAVGLSLLVTLAGCGDGSAYSKASRAYNSGEYEKAIEFFTQAAAESENPAIYGNRANCYSYLGDLDAALKDYEKAIEISLKVSNDEDDPRLAYIYYNRGHAYERSGKFKLAVSDYERTVALDDAYPDVKNNLAWVLATCPIKSVRDADKAIIIAQDVCERDGFRDPSTLDTLAAAYAANRDFPKAIEYQEKAVGLAGDDELANELQARLDLYRNSKPYLETEA